MSHCKEHGISNQFGCPKCLIKYAVNISEKQLAEEKITVENVKDKMIDLMEQDIESLLDKLKVATDALRFYGNIGDFYSENKTDVYGYGFQEEKGAEEEWGLIDGGDRAREALKQLEGEK